MVQWFTMIEVCVLKNSEATNGGSFFEKINFQGRNKLHF